MSSIVTNTIPTLRPEKKHYPALGTSVRMAPADCAWPGWLDLGDAVAIAYGPSEGCDGAADPKKSASWLIAKVCTPFRSPHDTLPDRIAT